MVYCGQPSKACAECRLRRTKCDTLRPSCSQCVRGGRVCAGYRDPKDMMFRDESKTLSAKRERKAGKKDRPVSPPTTTTAASSSSSSSASSSEGSEKILDPSTALSKAHSNLNAQVPPPPVFMYPTLSSSADDQATCFFFSNYVLNEHYFKNGNFQYLSDIHGTQAFIPALSDCVVSLGMVGLSNFWKAPNIMVNAHMKYNSALQQVSSRLRNIEEAKADQTLVAVMLLGLYETNTCSGPQSMKSWTKHINGAATLLNLRGKQQLTTHVGRQIFVHLRTQVITNCIQRHVPVPATMSEWSRVSLQYESPVEAASTHLASLNILFANIRASLSSFHDYSNAANVVASLIALDAEYENWVTKCPAEFLYNTVPINHPAEDVYGDHYHVYSSVWTATVWNHYRCARILANEVILAQLSYLIGEETSFESDAFINPEYLSSTAESNSYYKNQFFNSSATLQSLSADICASAPFFLSPHPTSSASNTNFPPNNGTSAAPPKAVSGNLLLWPLYTAACTGMVSEMMRNWVAGRLNMISDTLGIRQAAPLAQSLLTTRDIDTLEWEEVEVKSPEVNMLASRAGVIEEVSVDMGMIEGGMMCFEEALNADSGLVDFNFAE